MIKNVFSNRKRKFFLLTAIFFSLVIAGLSVTPNYSCGCGEIEDGTKLTYLINKVSITVIGKKVIETNKSLK